MKRIIILPLILFLLTSFMFAQGTTKSGQVMDANNSIIMGGQRTVYKGTPYFSDWLKGYLILDNNSKTNDMLLRYDMNKEQLEFQRKKKMFAISVEKINKYVIYATNRNIVFQNGFSTDIDEDINKNTLFRVIYNGKYKLLAYHSSYLDKNIYEYNNANDLQEYRNTIEYFLVTPNGKFHEVELKLKDILNILPGENENLKKYAAQNSLDEFYPEIQVRMILEFYEKK